MAVASVVVPRRRACRRPLVPFTQNCVSSSRQRIRVTCGRPCYSTASANRSTWSSDATVGWKSSNLLAVVICRDVDDLCDLIATMVGVCWVLGLGGVWVGRLGWLGVRVLGVWVYKCPCPPRVLGGTGLVVCVRRCPTFPPVWVVSSALAGLASGFGMGPGVSLSLWPP